MEDSAGIQDATLASQSFTQYVPIVEWTSAPSAIKPELDVEPQTAGQRVEEFQYTYYQGNLLKAQTLAQPLMSASDKTLALMARYTHLAASVGLGDPQTAFADLQKICMACKSGFECAEDDPVHFQASVLCGDRLEALLLAKLFDFPELEDGIDFLSRGLKGYYGFLRGLEALRNGDYRYAIGIAQAFLMIIGHQNPIPETLLHILAASGLMLSNETRLALEEYGKAWKLAEQAGMIMPFVEFHFLLPGLHRNYFNGISSGTYRKIESMVPIYQDGWFGLRRMCGFEDRVYMLTPLETHVASLVSLGWRNKEIAAFLHIAENTVKHQLTNVYQKLDLDNRSELRKMFGCWSKSAFHLQQVHSASLNI